MTEENTGFFFKFESALVTAVWVNVIKPRAYKENGVEKGEPKYDCNFIWKPDHPDFVRLKAAAVAAMKAKWPSRDIRADFNAGEIKVPWQSGEAAIEKRTKKLAKKGQQYDGKLDFLKGHYVLKAASKYRPKLSIVHNGGILDLITDDLVAAHAKKFYGGVQCLAELQLWPYDGKKDDDKDGVTAYLKYVLSANKGEKIGGEGGQRPASEVFKGYVGTLTDVDPTAGQNLDDDIPF